MSVSSFTLLLDTELDNSWQLRFFVAEAATVNNETRSPGTVLSHFPVKNKGPSQQQSSMNLS